MARQPAEPDNLRTQVATGADLDAALADLADLRMAVFRSWPYLYEGDLANEHRYLASYKDNPRAVIVLAYDGDKVVGAATGMPLADHLDASGMSGPLPPIDQVFYCAESVLLSNYRGRGIGHAFFDKREAHAKALGATYSSFCGVVRPVDHPLRPKDYRPLDPFWRRRGYTPLTDAFARFTWLDVGDKVASEKALQVWIKSL